MSANQPSGEFKTATVWRHEAHTAVELAAAMRDVASKLPESATARGRITAQARRWETFARLRGVEVAS
jgi:hypothetical protein